MQIKMNNCYNDGVLTVYNLGEDNSYNKILEGIRFKNKIVSFKRFYSAKIINEIIERVINIPNVLLIKTKVKTNDLIKIKDEIYQVLQIQEIELDLTLTLKAYEGVHSVD